MDDRYDDHTRDRTEPRRNKALGSHDEPRIPRRRRRETSGGSLVAAHGRRLGSLGGPIGTIIRRHRRRRERLVVRQGAIQRAASSFVQMEELLREVH
jgi:hypothetical protein